MLPAYPVPVPEGVPDWLSNAIFIAAGLGIFALLLWQVVRVFRRDRGDRS